MKENSSRHLFLDTPAPADLGPGPRAGVRTESEVRALAGPRGVKSDAYLALALLWHDHHEVAHAIAQGIETADGSYVHAILHRREPDYWNAKYWFRRVGRHPVYAELGRRLHEWLDGSGHESGADRWADRLAPGGQWDPMAFVDVCEAAAGQPGGSDAPRLFLCSIQRLEFEALADHLAS